MYKRSLSVLNIFQASENVLANKVQEKNFLPLAAHSRRQGLVKLYSQSSTRKRHCGCVGQ